MTSRHRHIQSVQRTTLRQLQRYTTSVHVRSLKLPPHPQSLGVVLSILLKKAGQLFKAQGQGHPKRRGCAAVRLCVSR